MSNNRKKESKELRPAKIQVIGDGDTEFYYFKHLKKFCGFDCELKRSRFRNPSIAEMGNTLELFSGNQVPVICVFDLDIVEKDKTVKDQLKQLKNKYLGIENFLFCGSFPSIEYWFLLHYEETNRHMSSKKAEAELRKYLPNYSKKVQFLKNAGWVENLVKRLSTAIDSAREFNSRDCECLQDCLENKTLSRSCTDLYKAFDFLKPRADKEEKSSPSAN